MANTDSISTFAEGSFEEQVEELVDYLARTREEVDRVGFKQHFLDALKPSEGEAPIENDEKKKRDVISHIVEAVDGIGEGSDTEIEGFFNLLFSHLISLYHLDASGLQNNIQRILNIISQNGSADQTSVKYRTLSNLFNAIPRSSAVRLAVCKVLLKLASDNDELDTLRLTTADVDRWLTEWSASSKEKSDFLKNIADAFASAGQIETAFVFYISHVRSLPLPESSESALHLISLALQTPTTFNFASLLSLENIKALSSNDLYRLLVILNNHGLEDFRAWLEKNQSLLDQYQLSVAQLERKLRLLVLSEIAFPRIGQNLHYDEIASALQIDTSEVEKWSIDAIRAGLLSGKLSQTTRTLHIAGASPRGFGPEQWGVLKQRLLAWKEGLAGIQSVLSATRQSIGAAVVPEQTA